jgi:AcrR family transcriptional regulator
MLENEMTVVDQKNELPPEFSLRTAQKEVTRSRIRDAARALFFSLGYAATTVEQIATAAGVSRATFYLHYKDKDEVTKDITLDYAPRALALMRRLEGPRPTLAHIRAWLREWADLVVAEKVSMTIFGSILNSDQTSPYPDYIQEIMDQMIAILALGIPAFNAATVVGPLQHEAKVRAELLIVQTAAICAVVARRSDSAYSEVALNVAASQFKVFISDRRFAESV